MLRGGMAPGTGPDSQVALHYGDPAGEARALERGVGLIDYSQLDVISVSGPERLTWLHLFLSQHVSELPVGRSTETLILDPAGHVQFAAAIIDDGAATWLITEAGSGAPLGEFLRSMQFAARIDIAERHELAAVGIGNFTQTPAALAQLLAGAVVWTDPWPATSGTSYGPEDSAHPAANWDFALALVAAAELPALADNWVAAGGVLVGSWAAEAARIAAWRPRFALEVDDRTIPHELDWLRTAVHLDKGCYRGQETVARVVTLGKPPRRLTFLHLDGSLSELPDTGDLVYAAGREVGHITSAALHHELGPIALAVLRRSVAPDTQLTVRHSESEIAAAQEEIVAASGKSAATPEVRPGAGLRASEARNPRLRDS